MRAEVNYADPSTRSFAGWAGIMAGLALGVAIVVGAMAWMARNRAPIKRAPARESTGHDDACHEITCQQAS